MKIKDSHGNEAILHQYMPYNDTYTGWDRGVDYINAWFNHSGDVLIVRDVQECIDYLKTWVDCTGVFSDERDPDHCYREITINGESYGNW